MRKQGFEGDVVLFAGENYMPYERPPLSKSVLLGEAEIEITYLRDNSFYEEANIQLRLGARVTALDCGKNIINIEGGEQLDYERLLLATGSDVRRLPIPGDELEGVYYLRGIDDMLALKQKLVKGAKIVVIGAGFIGLEVAAAAAKLGAQVSVIEVQNTILNRVVDEEVAARVAREHNEHGVKLLTNTGVNAIVGDGHARAVTLSNGEEITADAVVVGIGVIPNADLAEQAGIKVENGIVVNEYGETSAPNVYAAGDVTNHYNPLYDRRLRLESWQNAQDQAIAVARVMCDQREPYSAVPWFWSDQYAMNLQMAGVVDIFDEAVLRPGEDGTLLKFYLKDSRIMGAVGVNRGRDIMVVRRMITKGVSASANELANPAIELRSLGKNN
jgi:3-phenylpropionate/trans-cinnamate dioxygenase ferredoxin reductase subunit